MWNDGYKKIQFKDVLWFGAELFDSTLKDVDASMLSFLSALPDFHLLTSFL